MGTNYFNSKFSCFGNSSILTAGAASAAIAAATVSVGIAAFAVADVQQIITNGESNYLGFLGDNYSEIQAGFYMTASLFPMAGQYAQNGWGRQTSGTAQAGQKGPQVWNIYTN